MSKIDKFLWGLFAVLVLVAIYSQVIRETRKAGAEALPLCASHDASRWHGPTGWNCVYGHEHGDAPPDWIAAAGWEFSYDGTFNTSPMENTHKHPAMKGFLVTDFKDTQGRVTQVYFRAHAASNPLDRCARFHSYEVFLLDAQNQVSHLSGWYNTGDPAGEPTRHLRRVGVADPARPNILVVDETSANSGLGAEQWYPTTQWYPPGEQFPAGWFLPTPAWTIAETTTYYRANECGNTDQSTWVLRGDSFLGQTRRLEFTWPNTPSLMVFWPRNYPIYTDQFGWHGYGTEGECLMAPPITRFNISYPVQCQKQYISSGLGTIDYTVQGGNARQRTFTRTGVVVPN